MITHKFRLESLASMDPGRKHGWLRHCGKGPIPYWSPWCLCDGLSLGGQSSGNCLSSHSPVTVSMTGMTKERNPCRDSQRPQLPWCELKTAVTRSFMHGWWTRACPSCPIWITEQERREHSHWGGNRSFPRTDGPQGHPLAKFPRKLDRCRHWALRVRRQLSWGM